MFKGRSVTEPRSIKIFQTLAKQVRTGMPKDFLTGFVLKSQQFQLAIPLQRSTKINKLVLFIVSNSLLLRLSRHGALPKGRLVSLGVLDFSHDHTLRQVLGNGSCEG
jgi:hypothetical protein